MTMAVEDKIVTDQVADVFFDEGRVSVSISMYYNGEPERCPEEIEKNAREELKMMGFDVDGFECTIGDNIVNE